MITRTWSTEEANKGRNSLKKEDKGSLNQVHDEVSILQTEAGTKACPQRARLDSLLTPPLKFKDWSVIMLYNSEEQWYLKILTANVDLSQ